MKRTFIAFDIIPEATLKAAIETIRQKLRNERITWVQTDRLHVTLKFLGDTTEEQIQYIRKNLGHALINHIPFRIRIEGIGVFRNIHDPRVLWIACQAEKPLAGLREIIDAQTAKLGFERENRPFSPHITLGRIKLMRQTNHLSEILAEYRNKVFQESFVNEIIFYESQLNPEGPVYTAIEKFKFLPSQS